MDEVELKEKDEQDYIKLENPETKREIKISSKKN